ncbi:hypothetical protein M0805_006669 [Coniferiporia weirii]|nr:hypothetical protein M0805_006669 [Coniferiporia weirii]
MNDVDGILPAVSAVFQNPLATPPPDDAEHVLPDFPPARTRPSLSLLGLRIDSDAHHSALAYDTQHTPGLSAASPHAQTFRYACIPIGSSSVSAASGGDNSIYSSASTFEHSDAATSATSVSGYPSSPPPSRQHSDNGCDREKLSGANQFPPRSPVTSPIEQPATSFPERLNMPFPALLNEQRLQDHYPSISHTQHSDHGSSQRSLVQPQQHSHSHSHSQPSSLHSPSDRFPPLASMLAQDRYSRLERYPPPQTDHDRRGSDPSDHYPKHYAPQSMALGSNYPAPYTLHRVNRSESLSDFGPEPELSRADWQDEDRGRLSREGRSGVDPYSPIHSSFSSSNSSSLPTPGLPSPHASYLHSQGSRNYGGVPNGGYALYGSPEDLSYDNRPQSSSGDSNSPSYAYALPSDPAASPGSVHQQAAYSNPNDPASKTYSFVSLPGNTVRKRPRRRYDEIERLYSCSYPGCTKAYGTLNHLNAHVNMQKHGAKRHPNEFKEMRKQWRKMKKEQEQERERSSLTQSESFGPGSAQSVGMPGNGALTEVMRRRRVTDPNPYGLHSVNPDGGANGISPGSGPITTSVSDPLGIHPLDPSSYGLSSGLNMNVNMDSMGGMGVVGGYGHHHYVQNPSYHSQQRPGLSPVSPISPTSPTDPYGGRYSSNGTVLAPLSLTANAPGSSGVYYDPIPHEQRGEYEHDRARTPPPRNQLPPDATLCSAYSHHSQQSELSGDGYGLPSLSTIARMDHHNHHSSPH